jgi:hypothetical protein
MRGRTRSPSSTVHAIPRDGPWLLTHLARQRDIDVPDRADIYRKTH